VHLVCRKGSPLEAKALKDGFTVFAFPSVFGVIFFLLNKRSQYKIIHAQTSHILTYCLFTKPFHRSTIVFSRRTHVLPHGFFTKQKYLFTDKIVAVSDSVKETVVQFCGRTDIVIISDMAVKLNVDSTRAKKIIDPIAQNKHILGTTAALALGKDPLTMVEAIKKLTAIRKDFIFFHFGAGNLSEIVKQKIEEYNLQDYYILMGFKDNAEDFFSVFEIFIMSSDEEAVGSSVLDAFIYKVPVVSTNAGGLNDLLKEERGILCEVKNPQMIADGIHTLLESPEQKKVITDNAFDYVIQYHSMEYITNQYIELIKKIA
jgi:glycosyltransferase involved in cell wall biosynthesis